MERLNRLYLVRHGQVVGHERLPANGHTDVDITEMGMLQMEHLAGRLRLTDIKAIYSSDLQRTKKGAGIIGRNHDAPYRIIPEFRELCFGDWEGLDLEDIMNQYPGEMEKRRQEIVDYHPPGNGESMRDLSLRIMPRLMTMLKDEAGKDILLVAHGGVNRVILCSALGIDLANIFSIQQDYGCLNIIDYFADHALVRLING